MLTVLSMECWHFSWKKTLHPCFELPVKEVNKMWLKDWAIVYYFKETTEKYIITDVDLRHHKPIYIFLNNLCIKWKIKYFRILLRIFFVDTGNYRFPMEKHDCFRCGKSYNRNQLRNLLRHMQYECGRPQLFQCPLCPRKCKRNDVLERHLREIHKILDIP